MERRPTPSLDGRTRSSLLEKRPPTGVLFTAALALRSDHSAAAALIVLIFPMSAGRKYPPEDAWREESVFFFFDGAIPARSLDIREGDRAHIELVSEVAASGKSAIDVGFSNSNAMPEKLAPSHLPNYHL